MPFKLTNYSNKRGAFKQQSRINFAKQIQVNIKQDCQYFFLNNHELSKNKSNQDKNFDSKKLKIKISKQVLLSSDFSHT